MKQLKYFFADILSLILISLYIDTHMYVREIKKNTLFLLKIALFTLRIRKNYELSRV